MGDLLAERWRHVPSAHLSQMPGWHFARVTSSNPRLDPTRETRYVIIPFEKLMKLGPRGTQTLLAWLNRAGPGPESPPARLCYQRALQGRLVGSGAQGAERGGHRCRASGCLDPGCGWQDFTPTPPPPPCWPSGCSPRSDGPGTELESESCPWEEKRCWPGSRLLRKHRDGPVRKRALGPTRRRKQKACSSCFPAHPAAEPLHLHANDRSAFRQTMFTFGIQLSGENSRYQVLGGTSEACVQSSENLASPHC